MSPILDSLNSTNVVPLRQPPMEPGVGAAASERQLRDTASEILGTGERRFLRDDYDARMEAFAEELAGLSPEDGARLVAELTTQDPGALNSWLKLDTLDRLHGEGRVDQAGYQAVADAFASGYARGDIDQQQAETFLQQYTLDGMAPGHRIDAWTQARDFIGAMEPARADAFREAYATSLLERVADGGGQFHTSGVAMQLIADAGDPHMAARVFSQVTEAAGAGIGDPAQAASARAEARATLLEAIGESSIGFENSDGAFEGLRNPLATLIDSVAAQPDTQQWNEVAVEIARYAEASNDDIFFDPYTDKPIASTAEALSGLLSGEQGEAVLDALTTRDSASTRGGDGHAQEYGQNAIDLGNLLRITAFNPDNPAAGDAMQAVKDYAQTYKDFLNGVDRSYPPHLNDADAPQSEAVNRLGILGGAAFDAITQSKIDLDNREAATQQLVGFAVDLAVSAVPGGGAVSRLVGSDLKAVFGNNPAIDRVIDQALQGGDTLGSAAVDQLKQDIAGALSEGQVDLEVLRDQVNGFVVDTMLDGLRDVDGHTYRNQVENTIEAVQTDITQNRG
ncbi:hypothetical protein [Coralloluteibacterium thermophilus]|uniref:DUF1217 domain-containing protein n=1 Tax=Coralloluteibacterium thermophilum TaxID=2707049 RepID=A0ABV9NHQ9_9GAMM